MNSKRITACHIPVPSWAREFQVDIETEEEKEGYRQIQKRWAEIGPLLHNRIEEFFNDTEQVFLDEKEGFPLQERLTGEYYLGDVWCMQKESNNRFAIYCAISFRCLEKPWFPEQENRDYLGLEAGIYLWLDSKEIEVDDGFNTSSI